MLASGRALLLRPRAGNRCRRQRMVMHRLRQTTDSEAIDDPRDPVDISPKQIRFINLLQRYSANSLTQSKLDQQRVAAGSSQEAVDGLVAGVLPDCLRQSERGRETRHFG